MNTKDILHSAKTIATTLLLVVGVSYVSAQTSTWTKPEQQPPLGNVESPINKGNEAQYKTGRLLLEGGFTSTAGVVDSFVGKRIIAEDLTATQKIVTPEVSTEILTAAKQVNSPKLCTSYPDGTVSCVKYSRPYVSYYRLTDTALSKELGIHDVCSLASSAGTCHVFPHNISFNLSGVPGTSTYTYANDTIAEKTNITKGYGWTLERGASSNQCEAVCIAWNPPEDSPQEFNPWGGFFINYDPFAPVGCC